jgi:phosphatidylserine/phosphatidylglycerophosphate/cardiolipin synthase-like enzyme
VTAIAAGAATGLTDRAYGDLVRAAAERARRRIWASIFLYDLRPSRDLAGLVMALTDTLIQRHAAGVDVRVLVSGEVSTPDIAVANRATAMFLDRHGVPSRHVFGAAGSVRRGSHAKVVLMDDIAVLGSQNWTDDAFRLNVEDAVVLTGDAVRILGGAFQTTWQRARRLSP